MKLHPPLPIITTQPVSLYSFYHTTEGRRLSRPKWLVVYPDGLPACKQSPMQVITGLSATIALSAKQQHQSSGRRGVLPKTIYYCSEKSLQIQEADKSERKIYTAHKNRS